MTTHRIAITALVILAAAGPAASPLAAEGRPTTDQAIALSRQSIERRPDNPAAYLRLGDAYIQKSRQTGDLSYLTLAEQALRRSLELAPQSAAAARHLAYVFSSRHDFREAVTQARA